MAPKDVSMLATKWVQEISLARNIRTIDPSDELHSLFVATNDAHNIKISFGLHALSSGIYPV